MRPVAVVLCAAVLVAITSLCKQMLHVLGPLPHPAAQNSQPDYCSSSMGVRLRHVGACMLSFRRMPRSCVAPPQGGWELNTTGFGELAAGKDDNRAVVGVAKPRWTLLNAHHRCCRVAPRRCCGCPTLPRPMSCKPCQPTPASCSTFNAACTHCCPCHGYFQSPCALPSSALNQGCSTTHAPCVYAFAPLVASSTLSKARKPAAPRHPRLPVCGHWRAMGAHAVAAGVVDRRAATAWSLPPWCSSAWCMHTVALALHVSQERAGCHNGATTAASQRQHLTNYQ